MLDDFKDVNKSAYLQKILFEEATYQNLRELHYETFVDFYLIISFTVYYFN